MQGTAEARYNRMATERSAYEQDGEKAADLTIPSLYRRTKSKSQKIRQPFQSVGAKAVNTLAAKLLSVLLPPEASMFQLTIDTLKLAETGQPQFMSEIDKSLRMYESAVNNEIDSTENLEETEPIEQDTSFTEESLEKNGKLIVVHACGGDPANKIIKQVWPKENPFPSLYPAIIRYLKSVSYTHLRAHET